MQTDLERYSADVVLEVTHQAVIVHHDAAVDVIGGRVSAIGPVDRLAPLPDGATHHRLGGLLMPGLVNTHCHAPMVLFRSAGDGYPLDRWLTDVIWPREANLTPDDVHAGMLLGSAEMLLAGVTTSVEMYLHDEAIIDAVVTTGARLVSTPGIIMALHGTDLDGRLAEIQSLHQRRHRPDDRISVGFGPHSVYDLGPAMLRRLADAAGDVDALVHVHLEETEAERHLVLGREGRSATQVLADSGILDHRVIGAHGVWLSPDDRALLSDAGASIAHCPSSNLKLGSGFADVTALMAAGINTTVATDGAASADSLDLWHGVRVAPGIARALHTDPTALSVDDTLRMATANGGLAIGQPDVGTLTVGSRADLIRLDLDHPMFSPTIDDHELLSHVVFNTTGQFVTDVWVDGTPVVVDRRCLGVDVEAGWADLRDRARRLSAG